MIEAIAWPAAFGLVALVGMGVFYRPIARLIDRTKKVSRAGLETGEPQQLVARDKNDPLQAFLEEYDNQLIRNQEGVIRQDIERRGFSDHEAVERALVRSLAAAQVEAFFERTQGMIYGSQISALTWLNSRVQGSEGELHNFYETAKALFPDTYSAISFDAWVSFIVGVGLVEQTDDQYVITVTGREFLKWRIDNGRAAPVHS